VNEVFMIDITDSPDIKRWGEFVYNHPHGNIFQTPEIAEVYMNKVISRVIGGY